MWVKLSDVCQGGYGVVGLPTFVQMALYKTSRLIQCEAREEPPTFAEYLNQLAVKVYAGQELYPPESIERIQAFEHLYIPDFAARPTVEQIEIDTNYCSPRRVRDLPVKLTTAQTFTWDCAGKFNAKNFFQFFYHEKTAFLRDPMTIWECALENFQLDTSAFAAFVQLLGMQAEMRFTIPPPHVVTNVLLRAGLSDDERKTRANAVPLVLDFCIERTLALMQ